MEGKKFHELMMFYSSNFTPWNIRFNAFVWRLEKLDKQPGLKMLRNLGNELKVKEMWFKKHESELNPYIPFSARIILKQQTMMITTLIAWVDGAIEDYKKLKSPRRREFNISAVKRLHDH